MYKSLKIGVIVPAYNEEKLVSKTITTLPDFVDKVFAVNDGSKDNTLEILNSLAKTNKKLTVIDNEVNKGLGTSLTNGLKMASKSGCDAVAIMAGDAQMDPNYLAPMLQDLIDRKLDFIKANRFMHREALKAMPTYRRIGNIVITILTKFATGYYSIFDSQNGYAIYTKKVIDSIPFELVGKRYDFENTTLIAMSIIGARVGDHAVPAVYGEEKSTIKFLPTTIKALKVVFAGFWRRVYYKYILYNFHPIALFLISGLMLLVPGFLFGLYLVVDRIFFGVTPTSGTVMLSVLPSILGFQLLLTAFLLDVMEDTRNRP